MKLLYFSLIACSIVSCKATYTVNDLKKNYQIRMESGLKIEVIDPETGEKSFRPKGEIFETYSVYMSPTEVKNNYEVLAVYQQGFWTKNGRRKKWLESSMIKCASLGGNAIIIQAPLTSSLIIKENK